MNETNFKIRLMGPDDFNSVVRTDEKVRKASRLEYYQIKFERLVQSKDNLPISLVAEKEDGTLVGFIMGELYMGQYGISQEKATLDTIVVDPEYQNKGVGELLINEFISHLKNLGVENINTLVDWNDYRLIHFFSAHRFMPSRVINLVRSI